jgi:hypothetical protein
MDKNTMKIVGIVALVICVVCIYVAIERYQTNANNVRAMNQFTGSSPFSTMMPQMQMEMKPAMPAITKYAIVFALISGIGGVVLLIKSKNENPVRQNNEQQTNS